MLAPQVWCLRSFTAVEIVSETLRVAILAPMIGEKVRREKALDFSGCKSRVAADKAVSLGGENPSPSVA
jgi:hypothetical protein